MAAGKFTVPGPTQDPARPPLDVPAMCRVAGVIAPAIKFEVWLPEGSAWNGRFQMVGGGGLAGIISYPAMAEAVRARLRVDVDRHGPRVDATRPGCSTANA